MASSRPCGGSFSRNISDAASTLIPGVKLGPNGTSFLSSGISDLDQILGGGFTLGSVIMVMEDPEAPHHMLLLRNFMSQGVIHKQPLLYASPERDPLGFLGTLPNLMASKEEKSHERPLAQDANLRIAWQYKKYFGKQNLEVLRVIPSSNIVKTLNVEKLWDQALLLTRTSCLVGRLNIATTLTCESLWKGISIVGSRSDGNITCAGRIAIQSLCSPQCDFSDKEWDMLSFIRSLKGLVRSSGAVAVISFPPSLVSPTFLKNWQHLADTLISVKAIPDEDKELAKLLTGYQDMLGLLSIHKVARINTQVPAILEATTFSMKLRKRRALVLECLNQAPVDGSSGSSYGTFGSCSGSSKTGNLDF